MVLSPGATTTTICQPVTPDTCKSMSLVVEVLEKGTQSKICGGIWLQPSKDLQRLIKELENCLSFTSALAMKEGYGELFHIRRKDQMEENDTKLFDWTSSSIVSAPIGTYYSIEGGIIHAGAGAINGEALESCCSGPGMRWGQRNMTETNRKQS